MTLWRVNCLVDNCLRANISWNWNLPVQSAPSFPVRRWYVSACPDQKQFRRPCAPPAHLQVRIGSLNLKANITAGSIVVLSEVTPQLRMDALVRPQHLRPRASVRTRMRTHTTSFSPGTTSPPCARHWKRTPTLPL